MPEMPEIPESIVVSMQTTIIQKKDDLTRITNQIEYTKKELERLENLRLTSEKEIYDLADFLQTHNPEGVPESTWREKFGLDIYKIFLP